MSQSIDDMIDEVAAITPSTDWPPHLGSDEKLRFEGQFNRDAWLKSNVGVTFILFAIIATLAFLMGRPISVQGMVFVTILAIVGGAITFAMYHRQEWIITNRAVYVNRGRPMLLSSARKIVGFGSTVRLTGRWGVGITLLGVTNAAQIRASLQGRAA